MKIQEVVKQIKNNQILAEDLVKTHLQLAKHIDKQLNAFITILDDAIAQAKVIDNKIKEGKKVGRLAGIPFTVKDVFMTKNIKTTAGSKFLEDFVAPYTATVIKKLLDEDAILIGKSNCDPFAFGASGENSGYGPTLNPLDHSRVPGGSSSGASALVASKVGFFAIGSDTGGSVRQPASFCGVVGFKPTYGLNSRYGLIAMASSFDTVGILANNVEDVALVEEIIAGKDNLDATSLNHKKEIYSKSIKLKKDFKGVKIAVIKEFLEQGINQEVKAQTEKAIKKLKENGAEVDMISLPVLKNGVAVYYILVPSEISSNMARFDALRYGKFVSKEYTTNLIESRGKFLEDEVKRRILIGTFCLSAGYADKYYQKASKVRKLIKSEINKLFLNYDLLIGPVSPTTAFKLGENINDPLKMYLSDVYTVIANIAGIPAISIPNGTDSAGMPIGLQIMSNHLTESSLLNYSYLFEKLNV